MEKPDRQEFTREFGARAAAKYATAMRNYRKFLKKQPKPNPKAASEAARIASAMKREVGTRKSQKITGAMKRDVNTRNSQKVTDSMKRDANKPNSARASTKQQRTPTTNTPTTPSNTRQKRQPGSTGGRGRAPSGTRGEFLPSNPKLKSQPKPTRRTRRGSGVKPTGNKVNLGKALQNLSDKFKLTRKAGEVFTVGNMRYVSDGKGGIRSSQRIR